MPNIDKIELSNILQNATRKIRPLGGANIGQMKRKSGSQLRFWVFKNMDANKKSINHINVRTTVR